MLASAGSIHCFEPMLDLLQRGSDLGKGFSELLQRLDFASKEAKFRWLGLGTGFGGFVTSSLQPVLIRYGYRGCGR